jgi:hypothetical protein
VRADRDGSAAVVNLIGHRLVAVWWVIRNPRDVRIEVPSA